MAPAPSVPDFGTPVWIGVAAIGLLAGTATLYAVDLFEPSGGLVWVPFHAALVGAVSATVVGYLDRGVIAGFAVAYAPFLGFHLEWALLGISARPLTARLAYFVRPDGLAALGIEAVVVGGIGYAVGRAVRWATVDRPRSPTAE